MFVFFFFNDTATTEIYTLSLHDALPISKSGGRESKACPQGNPRGAGHAPLVSRPQGRVHLHMHRGQRRARDGRARRGGQLMTEPLSFEKSRPNAHAPRLPDADVVAAEAGDVIPRELLRAQAPALPRLSEPEVMRHYSRLASMNYSISEQFYPLCSCTMKYNPVANEAAAHPPVFTPLHPYQAEYTVQCAIW